jgi:hypothetical protein
MSRSKTPLPPQGGDPDPDFDPDALLDYGAIKGLAEQLGRPAKTLIVEALNNDPFCITGARQARAEWFAEIYRRLEMPVGIHTRRAHYMMVSQTKPILKLDNEPYQNTSEDAAELSDASRDARHLDLIPAEDFVDRRNPDAVLHLDTVEWSAELSTLTSTPAIVRSNLPMPPLPRLYLTSPKIAQRYHVEIWCEKSTVDDILGPLAKQYGVNFVSGAGESSHTQCVYVVKRSEASDLPVRILYISDFDPGGRSMPVAVARKIQHRIYLKEFHHLDIQVRPIALTPEQCEHYRLPRTPLKKTEKRRDRFQVRFGIGATELDALEAKHPGELRRIVEQEILRYYDPDLAQQITDTATDVKNELDDINGRIHRQQQTNIRSLCAAWDRLQRQHEKKLAVWQKRAKHTWRTIAISLERERPDLDAVDWPEPREGDEDDDPLFDSTRDYVEQVDRFKQHQGKLTRRRARGELQQEKAKIAALKEEEKRSTGS